MTTRAALPRRIALALTTHAAAVLRPVRASWADAMTHELDHSESAFDALTWAAGCILATYVERSQVVPLLHSWPARGLLSLLIATQVLSMLFATVMTVAHRWHYPARSRLRAPSSASVQPPTCPPTSTST